MKKYLLTLVLIMFIVPSVALASWWNPFSWFNGWTFNKTNKIKIETSTLDIDAEIKAKVDEQVQVALQAKSEEDEEIAKQKIDEQKRVDAAVKAALNKQKLQEQTQTQTPTPTQVSQPTVVSTEENYYIKTKARVKELIGIYESYEIWLQDTNDQFRSASLTLAGYNLGGLYGNARDAAIALANESIKVNNQIMTNTKKSIAFHESLLDVINNDPKGFISEDIFNQLKTPGSLEEDIEDGMRKTNLSLESVMNSLKYHY